MTDKLRELVAKVPHEKDLSTVQGLPGEVVMVCSADYPCKKDCTRCGLEAILAEQAPGGEWDARAWLRKAFPDVREGFFNEIQDIVEAAYAAGRSSQPVEPRDPAGK